MLKLQVQTNNGKNMLMLPESWKETSTDQFQRIVRDWDGEDWILLFSIISGLNVDHVRESKDGKLESTFYMCIRYVFEDMVKWEELPVPKSIVFMSRAIPIPQNIGRLSIGQAIQARKSLEGVKDTRECLSIITAIYLQPLIDGAKFDHVRAIEIEQDLLLMPITDIFPIGFFLLRQLQNNGSWLQNALNLLLFKIKKMLPKRPGLRS